MIKYRICILKYKHIIPNKFEPLDIIKDTYNKIKYIWYILYFIIIIEKCNNMIPSHSITILGHLW